MVQSRKLLLNLTDVSTTTNTSNSITEMSKDTVNSGRYHIVTGDVEEVLKVLVSVAKQRPHGAGAFVDVLRLPLSSVVTQEGAVKTRVRMLHQLDLNTRGRHQNMKSGNDLHCLWFDSDLPSIVMIGCNNILYVNNSIRS